MSKIKKVFKSITSMLGLGAPDINIPKAEVPAAPAPVARTSTDADIVLGTPVDSTRTSGQGGTKKKVDPLGSLGLGGLSL